MEHTKLGSGDNSNQLVSGDEESYKASQKDLYHQLELPHLKDGAERILLHEITPQTIDDNEAKLKERIAKCRNIIESLKVELNEEKSKLELQKRVPQVYVDCDARCTSSNNISSSDLLIEEISYNSRSYSDSVDSKLSYDENLIEYEKQLQRYQNTLNMAQSEKKNAIRKQMLTKAYRLKLLEVENQCNIELLRVKQSLQCLEPLKIIAGKWGSSSDNMYDVNSYELIPRYPELIANSSCDINICDDMLNNKIESASEEVTKDNCISSI